MKIQRAEVLRYLGIKGVIEDKSINVLIDECIQEVLNEIKPKYIYNIYDIEQKLEQIEIKNANLILKGKDIFRHLKNSNKCAIMSATIGNYIDMRIRLYEKTNLTKALIVDACATAAVEELCNMVENEIKNIALKEYNLGITYRYSPGYGDFEIKLQPEIIKVLNSDIKIGLTCSENFILLPRKSVTAVIGLQNLSYITEHPGCNGCQNKTNCIYSKEGNYCGR